MLDTEKNIKAANDMWEEMLKESNITEEDINDPKYNYMDEE